MSDGRLRELERVYAASGLLEDRERLMAAGAQARMSFAWVCRVMGGPSMDTFLTWQNVPGVRGVLFPGTVHLSSYMDTEHTLSPLLCRYDTRAGRPHDHEPHRCTRPLHLVWRRQGEVTCKQCLHRARRFRIVSDPRFTLDGKVPADPKRWSAALADYQAVFWGLWHPILWQAGLPVGLP